MFGTKSGWPWPLPPLRFRRQCLWYIKTMNGMASSASFKLMPTNDNQGTWTCLTVVVYISSFSLSSTNRTLATCSFFWSFLVLIHGQQHQASKRVLKGITNHWIWWWLSDWFTWLSSYMWLFRDMTIKLIEDREVSRSFTNSSTVIGLVLCS